MAQQVQVVEDGLERSSPPRRTSLPGWALLGLGFLVGLALGSAFLSPDDGLLPAPDDRAQEEPQDDELALPPEARGIADVIGGFEDALVAVAVDATDVSDLITWPPQSPMNTSRMVDGLGLTVDSSGQYFAMATPLPESSGWMLSTGRYHSIVPQVADVTSFAWHDSIAGVLAYTTVVDSEWQLWRLQPNGNRDLVTAGEEPASALIGWGDWGFVVQEPSERITLLTPSGEFKANQQGTAFSSTPDGWIAAADETLMLLSSGGGVQRLRVDDELGRVSNAVVSPSGDLIAVVDLRGVHVISMEDLSIVAEFEGPTGGQLAWSGDSRFLAATKQRGLVVLDVIEKEEHHLLENRTLVFVDIR